MTKERTPSAEAGPPALDKRTQTRVLWNGALETMLQLDSCRFAYATDHLYAEGAPRLGFRGIVDPNVSVEGVLDDGILHHRFGDHSFLQRGRRFLAGERDAEFRRTRWTGLDGSHAPLLIDPTALFETLRGRAANVIHTSVTTYNETPCNVLTIPLDRETCEAWIDAGLAPDPGAFLTASHVVWGYSRRLRRRKPEQFSGQMALFVDPAFRRVLRVRTRIYLDLNKSARRIQVQILGGPVPAKDPRLAELDQIPVGEVRWKDGLPERPLTEAEARVTLDLSFDEFDEAELQPLDENTRRLLGLR